MKVLVVSGFLGSGKTTFIKEIARKTGREFVIYENEFGQQDLDARELKKIDDLTIYESTENCICCSGKQDFASSILTISNTLDPDYLIVEPTGVAKLSSVLDNVNLVSYERIELLEPVVIVDGTAWKFHKDKFEDIYLDQVKTTKAIVVSKTNMMGGGEVQELCAWLQEVNPQAYIETGSWEKLDPYVFFSLLERDCRESKCSEESNQEIDAGHSHTHDHHYHHDHEHGGNEYQHDKETGFESVSLRNIKLPSEGHLLWLMDALVVGVFGDIVRAKGILPCPNQWLRFDIAGKLWQVTGTEPSDDNESLGVFIGSDLHLDWIKEAFENGSLDS